MLPKVFFLFFVFPFLFNTIKSQFISNFTSIFIFGDSTVDTGNNNFFPSLLKANHPPYGKDYYNHTATGRFSNGELIPDMLAILLKFKKYGVPPYLNPKLLKNDLKTGVNFASAGSGFDNLTGSIFGVIPIEKQLENFKEYLEKLKTFFGEEEAEKIVKGGLVFISSGSIDFILNFYDFPIRSIEFSIEEYQDFILAKVQGFVKELYELGCRVIIVNGLLPIGCLPFQRTLKSPIHRNCIENENSNSQSYNKKLEELLSNLQAQLPRSNILYGDIYTPLLELINNPQEYGFEETKKGCCGTGLFEFGSLCTITSPLCSNTSQYIFFDSIHPTEAAYYHIKNYLVKNLFPKFSAITSF